MARPKYYVLTWDVEKQAFTPQPGVRSGPYSLFGLRKPLRKLRGLGYTAHRTFDPLGYYADSDPSVLVERR